MVWTRKQTIQFAVVRCSSCYGLGLRNGRHDETNPCNCVTREIFRRCLDRSKSIEFGKIARYNMVRSERAEKCFFNWGYERIEFTADFHNLVKRTGAFEWKLFSIYHVAENDWAQCCSKLGMDKGSFYHAVYRMESKIGRLAAELEPYSLIEVDFDKSKNQNRIHFWGRVRWRRKVH